ncbi:MAG: FG-GAP repeat protein, partial [Chloroflexi bacterium]|nr:FG-GAP repeat protein [Chloroflexota bacterium]
MNARRRALAVAVSGGILIAAAVLMHSYALPRAAEAGSYDGSASGLAAASDQLWHQDSPGVAGAAEPFDQFGDAVASGDFNGDGELDLAIGVPFEDIDGTDDAGAVNVLYGSADGLAAAGNQIWHQDVADIGGLAESDDVFGRALAAGDFNGDGRDDLAIGVPPEDVGSVVNAGAVNVLYGSASGLAAAEDQIWHQDVADVQGAVEAGDHFGDALAAGDF